MDQMSDDYQDIPKFEDDLLRELQLKEYPKEFLTHYYEAKLLIAAEKPRKAFDELCKHMS